MNKIIIIAALALIVSGCTEDQPVRSVDWFKDHAKERAETLAECKNNPGEKEFTPNCINAQKAENAIANARRGYSPLPTVKMGD